MSALLTVTIPGNPGDAAINAAWRSIIVPRRGARAASVRVVMSAKGKRFRASAIFAIDRARGLNLSGTAMMMHPAECSVVIRAYWPRQRHLPGTTDLPHGDADAVIKLVLDALEHSGFLDDDARVRTVTASKWLDKANPRIELEVHPVEVHPEHA